METTTKTHLSKTQVKNLAEKAGLKISKTLKGRVASYSTNGVVIDKPYYGEIFDIQREGEDTTGWVKIFYMGNSDNTAYETEQRKMLAEFLSVNNFEQSLTNAKLWRKTL
jgi:hypothetical protein